MPEPPVGAGDRVILAEARERRADALGTVLRVDPNVAMAEVEFEDRETWWVRLDDLRVLHPRRHKCRTVLQ